MKDKKFKFLFLIVDKDTTFTDQNVTAWKFVNIGETDCLINNQFLLQSPQSANPQCVFEESLFMNEKTANGYKLVFKNRASFIQRVQVIQKIEVPDND